MNCGEKIKQLRISKGLTQGELAKLLGIQPSSICMYENGERIPRDEIKYRIAKYFNKTVDEIFFVK